MKTKNKIALDARMIHHSGIGTYVRGLVSGFSNTGLPGNMELTLCGDAKGAGFRAQPFTEPIYSIGEQLAYPAQAHGYDIWHSPHYNIPYFKTSQKLVVTVHDLIHWVFRGRFFSRAQAYYTELLMRKVVKSADRIIAVSEKTKLDIMEFFQAPEDKITVVYEGVSPDFGISADAAELRDLRTRHKLPDNFFLYVGLIKPHKNVLWLARLFRRLFREKKISSPLVIVGKKDRKYGPGFEELETLGREEAVIYLDQAPKADLKVLYQSALALVHPSLYEGFGLTILEAMACGTPVAAFRTASIPEVAGDAGILIRPNDEEAMTDTLIRLEKSDSLRAQMKAKGLLQTKKFDWNDTAAKTLQVYREVLQR